MEEQIKNKKNSTLRAGMPRQTSLKRSADSYLPLKGAEVKKKLLPGFQTPPPNPEFSPKAMKEYGTYLCELRESRSLSLQTVSQETQIVVDVLKAMEEMNQEKFPSEMHLIGLMKLYAKYLGANPEEVLEIFRSNKVSEMQVNFDIINISKSKAKTVRRVLCIAVLAVLFLGALAVVLTAGYPQIQEFFARRAEKQLLRAAAAAAPVAVISSIYENTLALKEAVLLSKDNAEARVSVSSISPPVISVGERRTRYPLHEGVPVMVDLAQGVQYAVILRSVDLAARSLLLRFDPRSSNPSVPPRNAPAESAALTKENIQQEEVDGELISLLSAPEPSAIQFTIAPKLPNVEGYFRYEMNGIVKEGRLTAVISASAQNYVDIYLSNAAAVTLTINGVAPVISAQNLPIVLRIMWRRSSTVSELVGIPLS